ncbi:hypothetical protein HR45_07930 [Shewanella mangrovi]|uniref:Uncharacterized protein n=1 Tax=Shewanella mangrovi TaxID=1515746 RepID=A0A094JZB5_9GAMM|nr:TorF family putative porin [Shewanella mangrovi]KFZ37776.1 hypothetical protein HR45_07930 [Shewanella mangrovi]
MRSLFAVMCVLGIQPFSAVATTLALNGYNDYPFNGISLTQNNPALQGVLDWNKDTGVYRGRWAGSMEHFDTDVATDIYAGFSQAIASNWSFDVGVAKYSYWGAASSETLDYTETLAALSYRETKLTTGYAWDYFGTGAGHFVVKLAQNVPLTDNASLYLAVDRSQSLNKDKWSWEDSNNYIHWEITGNYDLRGFNLSAGVHNTTLSSYGDTRLLFGLSKTFSF